MTGIYIYLRNVDSKYHTGDIGKLSIKCLRSIGKLDDRILMEYFWHVDAIFTQYWHNIDEMYRENMSKLLAKCQWLSIIDEIYLKNLRKLNVNLFLKAP